MFLQTLGLKSDGRITEFVREKLKSPDDILLSSTDKRGKAPPKNKKDKLSIEEHIASFNPQISHYNREHAPNRRYLDPDLTITSMWEDYKANVSKVSYPVYRRVFESMNIGFSRPSQDNCDLCTRLEAHVASPEEDHNEDNCEICTELKGHRSRYTIARRQYQNYIESLSTDNFKGSLFAVDMQKVILLPKFMTKEHFFISRLVVFNETFASLSGDTDFLVLWHEGIAGRLASDVASAFIKCITSSEEDRIVFWSDNCSGQNKNWTLFTALTWCVNTEWGPTSVTAKFLERGHTFMRVDIVHGNIGSKMKKRKEIHTFNDFAELCQNASLKTKAVVMSHNDFYLFEDGHRSRQSKKVKLPLLANLCEVEFRKGSRSMWCKQSFDDIATEIDFLKPKFNLSIDPHKMVQSRGISSNKHQNILKLVESFPGPKKKVWLDMPINTESSDLLQTFS